MDLKSIFLEANEFKREKQFDKAMAIYSELFKKIPVEPSLHLEVGRVNYLTGYHMAAITDYMMGLHFMLTGTIIREKIHIVSEQDKQNLLTKGTLLSFSIGMSLLKEQCKGTSEEEINLKIFENVSLGLNDQFDSDFLKKIEDNGIAYALKNLDWSKIPITSGKQMGEVRDTYEKLVGFDLAA